MRKRRTRQHFIEDLGFNYVEKQALLGRCTLRRTTIDYGLDAELHTYSNTGEVENGVIYFQIKSTDKIKSLKNREEYVFDLSKKDLEYWLSEIFPIIIILYDAALDVAYFLDLQSYFQEKRILLRKINKFIRVYIPPNNKFNIEAVLYLRAQKNNLYGNIRNL